MMPDFSGLIWMFLAIMEPVIFIFIFGLYRYWWEPSISRDMTKAKHSSGAPAFIQNETGVDFMVSNKKLPEGVVYYKNRGWFLLPKKNVSQLQTEGKRGPGRPPKDTEKIDEKAQKEKIEVGEMILHTPILRGLGKQVFFGSVDSVALSNPTTIAHADLPKVRNLAPTMYQKTQLDALATGSRLEGMKMMGMSDAIKILLYVIIAAVPIAVTGLIVYLLIQ